MEYGKMKPSLETLAKCAGVTDRTIRSRLEELADLSAKLERGEIILANR